MVALAQSADGAHLYAGGQGGALWELDPKAGARLRPLTAHTAEVTALALSPAGPVRAVGVVEMPIAALAGRRLFSENITLRQWVLGGLTAVGVLLAALA